MASLLKAQFSILRKQSELYCDATSFGTDSLPFLKTSCEDIYGLTATDPMSMAHEKKYRNRAEFSLHKSSSLSEWHSKESPQGSCVFSDQKVNKNRW